MKKVINVHYKVCSSTLYKLSNLKSLWQKFEQVLRGAIDAQQASVISDRHTDKHTQERMDKVEGAAGLKID